MDGVKLSAYLRLYMSAVIRYVRIVRMFEYGLGRYRILLSSNFGQAYSSKLIT